MAAKFLAVGASGGTFAILGEGSCTLNEAMLKLLKANGVDVNSRVQTKPATKPAAEPPQKRSKHASDNAHWQPWPQFAPQYNTRSQLTSWRTAGCSRPHTAGPRMGRLQRSPAQHMQPAA